MVSTASLQNLIPTQSRWGLATKAVRVPLEFVEDIFAMIEEKMLSFQLTSIAPTEIIVEQVENEWTEEQIEAMQWTEEDEQEYYENAHLEAENERLEEVKIANEIPFERFSRERGLPPFGSPEWCAAMVIVAKKEHDVEFSRNKFLKRVIKEFCEGYSGSGDELRVMFRYNSFWKIPVRIQQKLGLKNPVGFGKS